MNVFYFNFRYMTIKTTNFAEAFKYYIQKWHIKTTGKFIILSRKVKDLNRVKQVKKGTKHWIMRVEEISNCCSFIRLSVHKIRRKKYNKPTILRTTSTVCWKRGKLRFHLILIYIASECLAYFNHLFCRPDIFTCLILSIIEKHLLIYESFYTVYTV